jgi:hypothetical protein
MQGATAMPINPSPLMTIQAMLALSLLAASASAQSPDERHDDKARALAIESLAELGAGKNPAAVTSIELTGTEIVMDLVENDHPITAPFYVRSASRILRTRDFDRGMEKTDSLDGSGTSRVLSRDLAVTTVGTGSDARRAIAAPSPAWMMRDPVAALRAAVTSPDVRREPDMMWHGVPQRVISFREGRTPVRIFVSAATGLPSATEALVTYDDRNISESIAWNALGDVIERTEYMNWSFVDGIRYPLQQDGFRDGQLIRTLSASSAKLDVPTEAMDLKLAPGEGLTPGSVQDYRPDQRVPGPYPDKPITEIAPGIVQIPNSWYSAIVRQDDGLVIIDAPISAGYSAGVIAEAERRFPGVRIKALVTSTGFFWHVAGVREYAARGIPIYAEARNVPVIERMLAARHTLAPDALARRPEIKPRVIAVDRRIEIGSGTNAIAVMPVARATQPMLMTYVADAKLLHSAEMVQPLGPGGAFLFPESLIELTRSVTEQGLKIGRIVGMHMSPTPWADVAAAIQAVGGQVRSGEKPVV